MITLAPEKLSVASLRLGQAHEGRGDFPGALACYDAAIGLIGRLQIDQIEKCRQLGVAWMNRGNALQKQNESMAAVAAYDEAIALLRELQPTPVHRNHLGAAWLNRGHALLTLETGRATQSFEEAIAILGELPLEQNPVYRLNLAGAWTNLAHAQLETSSPCARRSAVRALDLVAESKVSSVAAAEMSLRACRARVTALGELLCAAEAAGRPVDALAEEASDAIDQELAVARAWEERGIVALRPLALRLFCLGTQLYRVHQPHFLAEFILENLDLSRPNTFGRDAQFHAVAAEAVATALAELERPRLLIADAPESMRLLETVHDLRAVQSRLAGWNPNM